MSLILETLRNTPLRKASTEPDDDESKSDFMRRCMDEGDSKSDCEAAWNDYSDELELSTYGEALQKADKPDEEGDDGDEDNTPVGTGERFKKLRDKIARKGKVSDPDAVAAAVGRKKYGAKRFAEMGAAGRARKNTDGELTVRDINRALRKSADDLAREVIQTLRK